LISQTLQKGRKVYVEGRLQTRSWDGPDGSKRFKTEVVVSDIIFLDRPRSGLQEEAKPTPSPGKEPDSAKGQGSDDEEINLDDIPF